MPPKKSSGDSKKVEVKKKEKIIEDKTFGLKNKKGKKQQNYIKTVTTQVQSGGTKDRRQQVVDKAKEDKLKDAKKLAAAELNALFKPVEQKVPKGVDPKSVLCNYFKEGKCKKGEKCKFSHDMNIGRKAVKKSIYDDTDKADDMDTWDEEKLEEVINKKHGAEARPPTTIICKFFLDAVENNKYGWFWECPNGGKNCHYRHALPPGFVLKRDKKRMEDSVEKVSLEDLIERERAALSSNNLTRVTLESFLKWKQRKKREKIDMAQQQKDKRAADYKAGRGSGISGREMFEFNPDMVMADDEEADFDMSLYKRDDDEENDDEDEKVMVYEIDLESLAAQARESDDTGTTQASVKMSERVTHQEDESEKMDMAGALDPAGMPHDGVSASLAATVNGEALAGDAFDENLFDGEDLDLIEEELDTLELQNS